MNKKFMVFGPVAAIVVIGAIGGYLLLRQSVDRQNAAEMERRSQQANQPVENSGSAPAPSETIMGQYVSYTPDVIEKTPGTKILFFHAPWCPQCRMLDSDITKTELPDNLTIIKVDYDSNQELRQEYGVTLQTTLVMVDDKGKLVKKYVAYNEPSYQVAIKENLLNPWRYYLYRLLPVF